MNDTRTHYVLCSNAVFLTFLNLTRCIAMLANMIAESSPPAKLEESEPPPGEGKQNGENGGKKPVEKKERKRQQQQQRPHTDNALQPGNPFSEIQQDSNLRRKVVLKMALQRLVYDSDGKGGNDKREANPSSVPNVIPEGFFWRDYPTCEQVLYDNMADYYDISSGQRQSKLQVGTCEA